MNSQNPPDFVDTVETTTKAVAVLVYGAIIVKLAIVCFSSFGWLGGLFVFVLGVMFAALLAAPLVGIIAVVVGVIVAAIQHFNKKRVNRT